VRVEHRADGPGQLAHVKGPLAVGGELGGGGGPGGQPEVFRVPGLDALHQGTDLGRGGSEALADARHQRTGRGPQRETNRQTDAVEAGHIGQPGYPDSLSHGAETPQCLFGRNSGIRSAAPPA
jgi:hypothetical protein